MQAFQKSKIEYCTPHTTFIIENWELTLRLRSGTEVESWILLSFRPTGGICLKSLLMNKWMLHCIQHDRDDCHSVKYPCHSEWNEESLQLFCKYWQGLSLRSVWHKTILSFANCTQTDKSQLVPTRLVTNLFTVYCSLITHTSPQWNNNPISWGRHHITHTTFILPPITFDIV